MKYKDPITGELRDVIIKSGDTLPIGTIVDFDGDVIPDGYEEATEASDVVNSLEGNEIYRAPSVKAVNEVLNGNKPMGSIVVEDITCKNLLKCTVENQIKNGITITVNEDKSFHIKGTATATTIFIFAGGFLDLTLDAGTYTFSIGNATPSGVYINAYHSSSSLLTQITPTTKQKTFNVARKTTYIGFRTECYINSGVTIDMTIKPMIEKGSIATEYVEHKEYTNKEVYSTKEVEIGTWIDGKPLYSKVIKSTIPTTNTDGTLADSYVTIASNIETVFVEYGFIPLSSGVTNILPFINSNNYRTTIGISASKTLRIMNWIASNSGEQIIVSVMYTKTTD